MEFNAAFCLVGTISYHTAKQQAPIVPGPQPPSGDSIQVTMSPIQQLEGSPEWHGVFEGYQRNEIYFPELQPLERVYSQLVGKLAQQIHDIGEHQRIRVAALIQQLLRKPVHGVRMGNLPDIPTGSKELYIYIASRSNSLDPFLIQEVVKAICVDELSDLLKDYEKEVAKCYEICLSSGRRQNIPLTEADDLTSMSVEVKRSPEQFTIYCVRALKTYFQESMRLGFAFVQGHTRSSTVLYFAIPTTAVPFMPLLLLSHVAQLRRLEVQKIAVFDYFAVDLEEAQAYDLVSIPFARTAPTYYLLSIAMYTMAMPIIQGYCAIAQCIITCCP